MCYSFLSSRDLWLKTITCMQLLRNRLVAAARKSIRNNASLGQLYGHMQEAYNQMQTPLMYQDPSARVSITLSKTF